MLSTNGEDIVPPNLQRMAARCQKTILPHLDANPFVAKETEVEIVRDFVQKGIGYQ
jgi:hypothetical protein